MKNKLDLKNQYLRGEYRELIDAYEKNLNEKFGIEDVEVIALAHYRLGHFSKAEELFCILVQRHPQISSFWSNLGAIYSATGDHEKARNSYNEAIRLKKDNKDALFNLANLEKKQKRSKAAIGFYSQVLSLDPHHGAALKNLLLAYYEEKDFEKIISASGAAHSTMIENAEIICIRAMAKEQLGIQGARQDYEAAFTLSPKNAFVCQQFANFLKVQGDLSRAIKLYSRAYDCDSQSPFLLGHIYHLAGQVCDWKVLSTLAGPLRAQVHAAKPVPPFTLLGAFDDADFQKLNARHWVDQRFRSVGQPIKERPQPKGPGEKIRLGYFSADFHDHATTYLINKLFSCHDKENFEIIAFSYGIRREDEMRKRVMSSVDRFYDISQFSDQQIHELSYKEELDIAIDLKGFTYGHRIALFSSRLAPIQINYLGYPGTSGAEYFDYIIADEVVIPKGFESFYTEKVLRMPHSYQVNDSERRISSKVYTRAECGLPDSGFVYCSFNNTYKLTPEIFDIWCRVLLAVPGSVLWLLEDNGQARGNLLREAASRGVTADRIVFAPRMKVEEHLARHRLADLFLDTVPCNAHTTASDALWAGLPLLTCPGQSFASRVAASLLHAVGLPELVMPDLVQYERTAIELGRSPKAVTRLKEKLEKQKKSSPLYNTRQFTKDFEELLRSVTGVRKTISTPKPKR